MLSEDCLSRVLLQLTDVDFLTHPGNSDRTLKIVVLDLVHQLDLGSQRVTTESKNLQNFEKFDCQFEQRLLI